MRWPFRQAAAAQTRDVDATDRVVEYLLAAAQGGVADPVRTAAVIAGVGLIARSFAALVPEPADARLTRRYLAALGSELALRGRSYRLIESDTLRVVTDVEVGSNRAGELSYRLRRVLPGQELMPLVTVPASRVVDIQAPGGLRFNDSTAAAFAATERRMARDALAPSLSLQTQKDTGNSIGAQAAVAAGEAFAKLLAKDTPVLPAPPGFEARPTEMHALGAAELRRDLERSVLAQIGVPAELLAASGGASVRESYRRFVRSTVEPVAALAAEELGSKLGMPGFRLDATALQGADHASLARAALALVNAGVSLDDALAQVGLA